MEIQNQDKRPQKILVVGSKGHPREVQCYNWTEIDEVPNIADQDVVIINMASLTEKYSGENYFLQVGGLSQRRLFS